MTHFHNDKNQLRQTLLQMRQQLDADLLTGWNRAISQHVHQLTAQHQAQSIGVYWPIRNEPDLRALYAQWAVEGKQLSLPVVIDKNKPLKFFKWLPHEPVVRDAMGAPIPAAMAVEVAPELVLVPCVGFNDARVRLGYGGGFYDRTLSGSPSLRSIGVAYACAHANFATEIHDAILDIVITEEGLFN